MSWIDDTVWRFAVALLVGLIMGAEREHRRAKEPTRDFAGVRTFALVGLTGGITFYLGYGLGVAGILALGLLITTAYGRSKSEDIGITTEVALMLAFVLGGLAQQDPELALGLSVVATFLLALRNPLHRFTQKVLSEQELVDALTFAVAALVVLPMVPDRTIDPWESINPFTLWRLAVAIMGIMAFGYIALRWLGPRKGLFLAGIASGFVSSVATIHAMGNRVKEDPSMEKGAVAGATASTISTFVQLALVIGVVNTRFLFQAAPVIAAGAITAAVYGALQVRHIPAHTNPAMNSGRALRWQPAVAFVVLVAIATLFSEGLNRAVGETGALVGALLTGLADVHAGASVTASLLVENKINESAGLLALMLAISSNTLSKMGFAFASGTRSYRRSVIVGLMFVLAAVWTTYLILHFTR